MGRPAERFALCRRLRTSVSDTDRPDTLRFRLSAEPDSRSAGRWQAADTALAGAFQHRAGVLMMRVLRRLVHVLAIVLTLIIGATAAVIIVAETAWFKNLLRAY